MCHSQQWNEHSLLTHKTALINQSRSHTGCTAGVPNEPFWHTLGLVVLTENFNFYNLQFLHLFLRPGAPLLARVERSGSMTVSWSQVPTATCVYVQCFWCSPSAACRKECGEFAAGHFILDQKEHSCKAFQCQSKFIAPGKCAGSILSSPVFSKQKFPEVYIITMH